jgi:hypothetical protein
MDRLNTSVHSLIGSLIPDARDNLGLKVSIEHCMDLFKLAKLALNPRCWLTRYLCHYYLPSYTGAD